MKLMSQYIRIAAMAFALTLAGLSAGAEEPVSGGEPSDMEIVSNPESQTIVIQPLFEYPMAPDSIPSLERKSDYVVTHFWDPMNFKNKETVDQNALNDAFQVWVSPMRWANQDLVNQSVAALLKNIKKNPALTLQMARAAEEALYSSRAVYWNDRLYLKFIDALLSQKKISNARKARYQRHKQLIENTLVGEYPKPFRYTTPTGSPAHYAPSAVITVIEFGDPDCDECRYAKLKMETDVTFSSLVDKGKVNVLFIMPDPEEGWQTQLAGFSPKWHTGASEEVSDLYDIRMMPSFFVIGNDGKLIAKNLPYHRAMSTAIKAANASN